MFLLNNKRRKYLVLLSGIVLLFGGFLSWKWMPQDDVSLNLKMLDFGVFEGNPGGVSIFRTIKISNKTDKDLKILRVLTTCNCIEIHKRPKSVAAHSEAELVFRMTLKPTDIAGKLLQMTILTDSEKYTRLEFEATGIVKKSFYSVPEQINFGVISNLDSTFSNFLIVNIYGFPRDTKIADVKASSSIISVVKKHEDEEKEVPLPNGERISLKSIEFMVQLNLKDTLALTNLKQKESAESVTVTLNSGEKLEIPVSWSFSKNTQHVPNK